MGTRFTVSTVAVPTDARRRPHVSACARDNTHTPRDRARPYRRWIPAALWLACWPMVVRAEAGPSAQGTARIHLTRPAERWVVQRHADNRGVLPIEGSAPQDAERVEARTAPTTTAYSGQGVDWTAVTLHAPIKDGAFGARCRCRQGGGIASTCAP